MARTDIRAVEGPEATINRAKASVDAGVDANFPGVMVDLREFVEVRADPDVPTHANMTEFATCEFFALREFGEVGINKVIFSASLLRSVMGATSRELDAI